MARARYSFFRKVIAPCNDNISFKLASDWNDIWKAQATKTSRLEASSDAGFAERSESGLATYILDGGVDFDHAGLAGLLVGRSIFVLDFVLLVDFDVVGVDLDLVDLSDRRGTRG